MTELMLVLIDGAVAVLTALIIALSAWAVRAINAITNRSNDQRTREFMDEAIGRVNDLADKVVTRIEQTVAKKLREEIRDGTKDASELAALGEAACQEILLSLNDDYKAALEDAVGDIEAYIADTVESKVYALKECAGTVLIGSDAT